MPATTCHFHSSPTPSCTHRPPPATPAPHHTLPCCRDISNNSLQGSIPASWDGMPSLRRIDLQPGNPQACPQAPAGSSFRVCSEGDVLCVSQLPYDESLCQGAPYPDDGSGGSSFPVAAVAVPVAVVGAAVIATWAYWLWRRRRRAAARRAASVQQQQESVHKEWVGQVSFVALVLFA